MPKNKTPIHHHLENPNSQDNLYISTNRTIANSKIPIKENKNLTKN